MRKGLLLSLALFVSLSAESLFSQDAKSAEDFMQSAFHLYERSGKGVPYRSDFYHTSLLALIKADLEAAEKGLTVPMAGTDLFCDCQERDGISIHKLDVRLEAPDRAEVTVSFSIYTYTPEHRKDYDSRTMKYTLVPERGRWRVYDILDLSEPDRDGQSKSFRVQLGEEIRAFARTTRLPMK